MSTSELKSFNATVRANPMGTSRSQETSSATCQKHLGSPHSSPPGLWSPGAILLPWRPSLWRFQFQVEAIAIRVEQSAITIRVEPSLLGWRPLLVAWSLEIPFQVAELGNPRLLRTTSVSATSPRGPRAPRDPPGSSAASAGKPGVVRGRVGWCQLYSQGCKLCCGDMVYWNMQCR